MAIKDSRVAIIGGTGGLGSGLADRLLRNGFELIIGSRDAGKAKAAAEELKERLPLSKVVGLENKEAAHLARTVAVTVPFSSHAATLRGIADEVAGKIVIDATVCLNPPKVGTVHIPPEGSACVQAQHILGPNVRVVSAFQNISASHLAGNGSLNCDVLVCGDDPEARAEVMAMIDQIGLVAWDAGPIANSAAVEAMTSVLISINRRHKLSGAGVRIMAAHG